VRRAEVEGLPAHKRSQAGRHLIGWRHRGSLNQDRDKADVTFQSRLDLKPHEVLGVIEAPPPVIAGDREPLPADQRQQHVTSPDRVGDHLDEVVARLDRVHILEDLAFAEVPGEPFDQPAGRHAVLVVPVADEDPARVCRPGYIHDLDLAPHNRLGS